MKKKATSNRVRLNIRLPSDLVEWARVYAGDNKTTITSLLVTYLMELKEKIETGKVEQF